MFKIAARFGTAAALLTAVTTPALAHHPLAGAPMDTFAHGVLSGIGHPLLGFDHLLFVVVVGIAAILAGRALLAPAAYIGAMLAGCVLMSAGIGLPLTEVVIGLSLLIMGGLILSGRAVGAGMTMALFALFGLFHGSAFGGTIAGQEGGVGGAVFAGYLLGLGAMQYLIAVASGWTLHAVSGKVDASTVTARIAGATVAGAGLLLTLENAEGMVFDAMGWAV